MSPIESRGETPLGMILSGDEGLVAVLEWLQTKAGWV
jgi:hypothetical protein